MNFRFNMRPVRSQGRRRWQHTCAVLATGTFVCWGSTHRGELGGGAKLAKTTSVTVKGLVGAKAVAAGSACTCTQPANSAVNCWGRKDYRQHGDRSALHIPMAADCHKHVQPISKWRSTTARVRFGTAWPTARPACRATEDARSAIAES